MYPTLSRKEGRRLLFIEFGTSILEEQKELIASTRIESRAERILFSCVGRSPVDIRRKLALHPDFK